MSSASGALASSRPRDLRQALQQGFTIELPPSLRRLVVEGRELAGQRIGPLRDGAGAQAHDDVAGLHQVAHQRRQLFRLVDAACTERWPRALRPSTSDMWLAPSIGASPAA